MEFVQQLGRKVLSAFSIHQSPKVIVKNLPKTWTEEELQCFLEKEMGLLKLKDDGIHTFGNIMHTVLVSLEKPMTDQAIKYANEALHKVTFSAHSLQLEAVESATSSLLLHHQCPDTESAHERFSRFLNSLNPNNEDEQKAYEICGVETYDDLSLIVFKFTSPKAVQAIVCNEECHQEHEMVLEPWYEDFHGRLLREMLRHKVAQLSPESPKDFHTLEGAAYQFLPYGGQYEGAGQLDEELLESIVFPQQVRLFNLVIVSNLPEQWTSDELKNYIEQEMRVCILKNHGIHVFRKVTHTALLSLDEPLTEDSVEDAKRTVSASSFLGHKLEVEALESSTISLLVDHMCLDMENAHERFNYILDLLNSDSEIQQTYIESPCRVEEYPDLGLTVFKFASADDIDAIVSYGKRKGGSEVLVMPWYEEFHGPLLRELLQRSTTKMSKTVERLTKEIADLEVTSADTVQQVQADTMMRHQREYERLKKEMEKLKNVKADLHTHFIDVPAYKLRLLADFADTWTGCKVLVLEQEEKAMFYGGEKECKDAKTQFMKRLQNLADDIINIPDSVIKVLRRQEGKEFLIDMLLRHPACSADVDSSGVLCASQEDDKLAAFRREFEKKIGTQICEVPLCLEQSAQFKQVKNKLETSYLVTIRRITSDTDEDAQIKVDGITSDVQLAASEIERYTNLNRPGSKHFNIRGALEGKACIKWFSSDLDKIKQMIIKNEGEIEKEETTSQGYTLVFTCRQEALGDVVNKLNIIKQSVNSTTVDLNEKFSLYADRALVVNGLLNMGKDTFCAQLVLRLQKERLNSMGDFRLLTRCELPPLGSVNIQKRPRPTSGRRRGSKSTASRHGRFRRPSFHPVWDPILPCTISVGNTNITIKAGDITEQKVDVAVCPVTSDLNLHKTHFGSDFLNICPHIEQKLKDSAVGKDIETDPRVIVVSLKGEKPEPGTDLFASAIYSAVLHKSFNKDPDKLSELVHQLTKHILNLALTSGMKSIVFPPLGVGRRFQYDKEVVARAMTSAFSEFLHNSPDKLQDIIVAVTDPSVAFHFAQVVKQNNLGPVSGPNLSLFGGNNAEAAEITAVIPEAEDDEDMEHPKTLVTDFVETPTDTFEAIIVTQKGHDSQAVIDVLLKELRTTFIWHETVTDIETFQKLSSEVQHEILSKAAQKDIFLSVSEKGLRICGQRDKVQQILLLVRDKMYNLVVQQSKQGWEKRSQMGLPVDTDHLPAYWKMRQQDQSITYDKAMELWNKQGIHTNPLTPEEYAQVEQLLITTWEAEKAGFGKDARNLRHTSIQVVDIERLENPELWRVYSQKREQLFNGLVDHHTGSDPPLYTRVENLQGSRGAVKTTENIAKKSLLDRDIYSQVNEHYLFHGTKKEILRKIYGQGLDFRLSRDGMLGRGVYAAESPTKSDQYTDHKASRTDGVELQMFLVRMMLGEPFLHNNAKGTAFSRPPCMTCSQMVCNCPDSRLFNSVVDDARLFREFVVYDQNVCYPEYIITYKRM